MTACQPPLSSDSVTPVPGYDGLVVDARGRLFAREKDGDLVELRPWPSNTGYQVIRWRGRLLTAHRLICAAHHGPPPHNAVTHHQDGDKTNNHPDNLSWVTQRENARASLEFHGRTLTADRVNRARLEARKGRHNLAKIVLLESGVSRRSARAALTGDTWSWLDVAPVSGEVASEILYPTSAPVRSQKGEEGEE